MDDILNCWDEPLATALYDKLQDSHLKPEVMGRLLGILLHHNVQGAQEFATSLLADRSAEGDKRARALVAARILIVYAADVSWPAVWEVISQDAEFGKEVLSSAAHTHDRYAQYLAERISDDQLADLFLWLVDKYPFDQDPQHEGVHFVSPLDSIIMWRDSIPSVLVSSGRWTACLALRRLAQERPDLPWLRLSVLRAQAMYRRKNWTPIAPEHLLRLVKDHEARLVVSGERLLSVVIESLDRLQAKLQGVTPAAQFLWDRVETFCRPKEENALSDFVKLHLADELERRGVIVNREVEVRRLNVMGIGERTDILVNASVPAVQLEERDTISLVIEVKGSWYSKIYAEMRNQLYERYLKDTGYDYGLYLIGWYNCPQWEADVEDGRYKTARPRSIGAIDQKCTEMEKELAQTGKTIKHYILNVALPGN